ncbi:hypothetical protein [Winogradskyella jejuensis]|uniref:Uncharacterized protein n=1 Tax=Winogradskyella jejuensis TaxID=1089305 RepID=A0A1M5S8L7_9FLAO|nr:hypothetical protein [Winogradskyella jejuensis]SHH34273.1 hypothetical protein SAMN05444148_1788 [Winogradskyella jejuensis]
MKLTLKDRINFSIEAIKKHLFLILGGLLFISIGLVLIYIGTIVNKDQLFFYIFGGVFIAFILFVWIYTLPSSLLFYYEKALIKKYGSYTTAIITNKEVEDHSHTEGMGRNRRFVELFMYLIEYKFEYNSKTYTGAFYLNEKAVFDAIELNQSIPIQFLKTNPKTSKIRRQKLCLDLGLNRNMCN